MKPGVLNQPWFAVGAPWGDGTWINAGTEDPASGEFVVDLVSPISDSERDKATAAGIAAHICKLHNSDLARRLLERNRGVLG